MAYSSDGLVDMTLRMVTLEHHLSDTTDTNLMVRDGD